ncbi:translation elongation factor Ts [Lichenihabitans psoromatis]|uniref:translation elongation factor Ts n=1 Tax=Lichenihabitans psoromatis TaxID=2528642 RepID=UPI001038535A|nr:translation elongation factor Ts [Lichenihabitans psoromatis]
MANITAAMVKELREKTGAGMMDCKNALNEVQGDIEGAVDWLRKKGLSKAAKKSGRIAAEGLVAIAIQGTKGVLVEVNSETDFVARNEDFQKLVRGIADVALAHQGSDAEALQSAAYPSGGTVSEAISNAIATIGENMTLRRVAGLEVSHGVIAHYVHNVITEGLGKIGVLVALESTGDAAALGTLGRQIAMHVAASSPLALDGSSLDPAIVTREKALLMDKNAGKPANVLEKIVESGLKSYYKEVSLLDQPFVHDNTKTVAQAAKDAEKQVGAPIVVKGFLRFALGEGIDKPNAPDFASEVASMV